MTETGTKIVFLDCDGVVSPLGARDCFDRRCMQRLKQIVDATRSKIVLSSSWRTSDFGRKEVAKQLVQHGMPSFIGCTPELRTSRATEILQWLEDNRFRLSIVNWVALDDIDLPSVAPDRTYFSRHAIVTNGVVGLTDSDVQRAIAILHDNNNNV